MNTHTAMANAAFIALRRSLLGLHDMDTGHGRAVSRLRFRPTCCNNTRPLRLPAQQQCAVYYYYH